MKNAKWLADLLGSTINGAFIEGPLFKQLDAETQALYRAGKLRAVEFTAFFRKNIGASVAGAATIQLYDETQVKADGITNLDYSKLTAPMNMIVTEFGMKYAAGANNSDTEVRGEAFNNLIFDAEQNAAGSAALSVTTSGTTAAAVKGRKVPATLLACDIALNINGNEFDRMNVADLFAYNDVETEATQKRVKNYNGFEWMWTPGKSYQPTLIVPATVTVANAATSNIHLETYLKGYGLRRISA